MKTIPSNVEAEQAVIGSCLLDSEAIYLIDLAASEFYLEKHAHIYSAMLDLMHAETPQPLDVLSVTNKLTQQNRLQSIGGIAYLTALLNAVPTASHVRHYAELVREAAQNRALVNAATEIAELAYRADMPIADKLERAQRHLLLSETNTQSDGAEMRAVVSELSRDVADYLENPRETFGLATHLDTDRVTGGLIAGDFWIIVGDPGNGKTALLHKIISNICRDNVRVWLYSFEMPKKRVAMRMTCERAGIDSKQLRRGAISQEEYERYVHIAAKVSEYPLRIFDNACSMTDIDAGLRRAERRNELPQVIAIDYSKLLTDKGENEVIRVGNITRMGKVLATRYGVTVLMIHVISGESAAQDRMPELRDLGWSRQSQYDPDVVIAAHKTKGIGVLKNREGEAGNGLAIPLVFIPQYTRWENATHENKPRVVLTPPPTWDGFPMPDEREYVCEAD